MSDEVAAWSVMTVGLVLGVWSLRTIARELKRPRDRQSNSDVAGHADSGVRAAISRELGATTPVQVVEPAPRWPEPWARTVPENVATWQRPEATPDRPAVEHTPQAVRLCGACRDGMMPGTRPSGYLRPQHAVKPVRYPIPADWPINDLAARGVRPVEVRCVQAKCRRDKALAPDALKELYKCVERWRQLYPALADRLTPTLVAWRDCLPETFAAAQESQLEVAAFCKPVDMPPELERPRAWEVGDEFFKQLGDWYEGVLAWSFEQSGYAVYWRGEEMGVRDGGVDLVCIRW